MIENSVNVTTGFFQRIFALFNKHEEVFAHDIASAEVVSNEIDMLWKMLRERETDGLSNSERRDIVATSFKRLQEKYVDEELDKLYVWPRFVKISIRISPEPVDSLIEYVNEFNYIYHTKRLSDLSKSVFKSDDAEVIKNMEVFMAAVYRHILDTINPEDIPSCLALGKLEQNNKNYDAAREWFSRVIGTKDSISGITALLACNEEEIKGIIAESRKLGRSELSKNEKIRQLNSQQCDLYDTWCGNLEKDIRGMKEASEEQKSDYVYLMTGYARFERNRDNYEKAFKILDMIPESYPEMYRVYAEKAMLYQFKPGRNNYYSLDKAIDFFRIAESAIDDKKVLKPVGVKGRKSILMPLANSYFQSGRYQEASELCDVVLKLDSGEQRAISLKNRIERMAS